MSAVASFTITSPIKKLKKQARSIVYQSGRMTGTFSASGRYDEIGDLAQTLAELTGRLEKQIRYIESFAADVSHEFKNPLASIRASADIINSKSLRKEEKKFITIILESVNRMEKLLTGVRELTSIDNFIEHESTQKTDLNRMCSMVTEGCKLHFQNISFADRTNKTIYVSADPDKLARALDNIIQNAVSFSSPQMEIIVTLSAKGNNAFISIEDSAGGIADDIRDKIFNRFFSYRPQNEEKSHTGLGLSIVKAIIEAYNGIISVKNNSHNGATFKITLPVSE